MKSRYSGIFHLKLNLFFTSVALDWVSVWLSQSHLKFIAISQFVLHPVFQIFYVGGGWSCEEDQCGAWWHRADLQPGFQYSLWAVGFFTAYYTQLLTFSYCKSCTNKAQVQPPLPKDVCKCLMHTSTENRAGRHLMRTNMRWMAFQRTVHHPLYFVPW